MAKFFLWVVVILTALIVTRVLAQKKTLSARSKSTRKHAKEAEPMVRCAHCGIYLPRSQALMSNDHTWCSLEHVKLGPRNL